MLTIGSGTPARSALRTIDIDTIEEARHPGVHGLGKVFGEVDSELQLIAVKVLRVVLAFQHIDHSFRNSGNSAMISHD